MPILDITEYQELAVTANGMVLMAGQEPSRLNQQVTIGAASTQSSPMGDATKFVRVHTDVACRVAIGTSPTAGPTSMRMGAGGTEYFGVRPGLRIAVIQTT